MIPTKVILPDLISLPYLVDAPGEYHYNSQSKQPVGAVTQPNAPRPPGPAGRGDGTTGREMGFVEDEESQDDQSDSEESEEVEEGPHVPLSG